ncbi:hypothetical protein [Amorphus suaedae]
MAIVVALAWRLPLGIDLSDEAYYVLFVDDWLKGGFATSTLTTIHQTALLAAYLPLRISTWIVGSTDGLVIQLRILFLVGSIVTALVWLRFLLQIIPPLQAWLGAAFFLSFIPFGLPSVSYNTLGSQGLGIALAALGLDLVRERLSGWWGFVSAVGWGVATTAYPSLLLPLVACLLLLWLTRCPKRDLLAYVCLTGAVQIVGWALVAYALSPGKVVDSFAYLAAINDVGGLGRKLDFALTVLGGHPIFVAVCCLAAAVGLLRERLGTPLASLAITALLAGLFAGPTALYCRSHDVVTVLALAGLGLALKLPRATQVSDRAIGLIYVTSLFAGAITMVSAFNGIYNFTIGAVAAAIMSTYTVTRSTSRFSWPATLCGAGAVAAVLATSLTFYYGTPPGTGLPDVRVHTGAFAGLRGQSDQVEAIRWMENEVTPQIGADGRIAFVGRLYGLILATPARPQMMAVFPLDTTMNPKGLAISGAFFDPPDHRPSLVVIQSDQYITPLNPFGPRFGQWYDLIEVSDQPLGHFEIYRRKEPAS